jgi:hypothetical protein
MTGKLSTVVTFPQTVRQELPYRCSACGADRGCDCNAPAIEKAATALARSPEKSDRAIAKEEGINRRTVAKARNQLVHGAPVDTRVGLDGKARRMPQRPSDKDEDNPPPDVPANKNAAAAARVLRDGLQAEFASRPKGPDGLEPHGTIRDLIIERLVEFVGPCTVAPKGRKLSDDFLREVFEDFLRRRREALFNLYGERTQKYLSTLDRAGAGGTAAAKNTQHRQFSDVYAVQASSSGIAQLTFLEPAPHQKGFPIIGYFLQRGPQDYAVLRADPKRYRTMGDALAAVAAASERAREGK